VCVADSIACRVRCVDTSRGLLAGTIETLAGTGACATSGDGGAALAAGVASPSGLAVDAPFGSATRLFISQVVLFVIVAVVLAKFAYKPLLAMLEQRKRQIQEGIENAEKTRKELANAQAKSQEILTNAGLQANKVVEEARAAAAAEREKARQQAVTDAQDIIAKARAASESELNRLKAELRREFGRLVVDASTRVTSKILTDADRNRLADEATRELAA
jgi:F-type H+-transporting ATPase subunit b